MHQMRQQQMWLQHQQQQERSPSPYLHEDALVDWTQQVSPERPGRKEIAVVDAQRGLLSPEERQEERRRQQITVIENELQDARELQTLQRLQVEAKEQQQQQSRQQERRGQQIAVIENELQRQKREMVTQRQRQERLQEKQRQRQERLQEKQWQERLQAQHQLLLAEQELQDVRELQTLQRLQVEAEEQRQQLPSASVSQERLQAQHQLLLAEQELQDVRELQTLQRLQVEAEEQQQQSRSGSVPHGAHELRYDRDREMEAILGEHVFCVQYWQRSLLALHASLIELCTQSRRAGDQGSGVLGPNGREPAETRRTCTPDGRQSCTVLHPHVYHCQHEPASA